MPVMPGISTLESVFMILIFIFGFGSSTGWILEVFFRRFISTNNPERKWINPGFLIGPCLPIYGFGLLALFLVSLVPDLSVQSGRTLTWKGVVAAIIIMGVLMTLIEYLAGIIFIKRLKLKLWDYSDMKGNIQGVICPQFSLIWTVLGALYYFFIQPYILKMVEWLYDNVGFIFFIGIYFGILIVDIGYSFNIAAKIKKYASENAIIVKYEEFKGIIIRYNEEHDIKNRFFNAFRSTLTIKEFLDEYMDKISSVGKTLGRTAEEKIEKVKDMILNDHKD
ncbi:MAG: putative ABC transporter permease [Lachnospiraceae bacterium]|nr:putative ABC transporter permease [Lachnospiraceae bacterium]